MGEFEISDDVAGASERPARTARNIFSILCSFNSYTVTLPSLCNHVPLHITRSYHQALLCFGPFYT